MRSELQAADIFTQTFESGVRWVIPLPLINVSLCRMSFGPLSTLTELCLSPPLLSISISLGAGIPLISASRTIPFGRVTSCSILRGLIIGTCTSLLSRKVTALAITVELFTSTSTSYRCISISVLKPMNSSREIFLTC